MPAAATALRSPEEGWQRYLSSHRIVTALLDKAHRVRHGADSPVGGGRPMGEKVNAITLRRWHSYIGFFIAPSVLFFALTGALQLFSLHEEHGNYRPPAIVEKLSSVHRDQVFAVGDHHTHPGADAGADVGKPAEPAAATAAAPAAAKEDADEPGLPTFILKIFFLIVGLGLAASAALGLWIGLTQTRSRGTAWLLVMSGSLIPVALLLI